MNSTLNSNPAIEEDESCDGELDLCTLRLKSCDEENEFYDEGHESCTFQLKSYTPIQILHSKNAPVWLH